MEKTAGQLQKERIMEMECRANGLLKSCSVLTLASVNEKGYPRICALSKQYAESFKEIYFVSSKRSAYNGKVTHFERNGKASVCYASGGDSVTLVGEVEFVIDRQVLEDMWSENNRPFFKKGIDDPKFRLIKFKTIEATFWIDKKFRTVQYKV